MKRYLPSVVGLYRAGKYKEALIVLDNIEKQGFVHPSILVWKSRCLQLTDDLSLVDLSEIEKLLKDALALDDEYLPALIDLAYFYLRIIDNAKKALPLFRKAFTLTAENATEAVIGLGESIAETKSTKAALNFLVKNSKLSIDSTKTDLLLQELQESLSTCDVCQCETKPNHAR